MGQLDIFKQLVSRNHDAAWAGNKFSVSVGELRWRPSSRDGGDQRQVGVPVESGLGGPTQKGAPPCGTRGLGSIESSNDD